MIGREMKSSWNKIKCVSLISNGWSKCDAVFEEVPQVGKSFIEKRAKK